MKPYSDLNTTYHWSNVAASRFFQSRKIALFIAVLGCLSLGTSGATAQSLSKISCQTNSFSSAGTNACSVYLSGVAQSQIPVYLYSSDSALTVRSTIYVKAGASTGGFSATLASVLSARTVWITAQTSNGNKVTYGIQLAPPAAASLSQPQLSKISCHSNSFSSAGTDACSVYLTGTTPSQIAVNLSSNNPAVTVSSHAWVLTSRSNGGFNVNVQSVTSAQIATITASAGGVSKTFSLQLNPSRICANSGSHSERNQHPVWRCQLELQNNTDGDPHLQRHGARHRKFCRCDRHWILNVRIEFSGHPESRSDPGPEFAVCTDRCWFGYRPVDDHQQLFLQPDCKFRVERNRYVHVPPD